MERWRRKKSIVMDVERKRYRFSLMICAFCRGWHEWIENSSWCFYTHRIPMSSYWDDANKVSASTHIATWLADKGTHLCWRSTNDSNRNKSLVHAKMQRHLFCYICNVIFVFVVVAIKMRFWCCGTTADHPNPNGLEISNYQIVQHQWDSKLETSKITNILPSVATNRSQKRAYQNKYKRSSIIDGPIVELKLSYANVYLISVYSRGDAQYQMSNFFFLMILSRLFPPLTVCTGFAAAAAAFLLI